MECIRIYYAGKLIFISHCFYKCYFIFCFIMLYFLFHKCSHFLILCSNLFNKKMNELLVDMCQLFFVMIWFSERACGETSFRVSALQT